MGSFHIKYNSCENVKLFAVLFDPHNFFTVDDYNRDKVPGAFLAFSTTRYWKSLVLLVVVVNGIFTLGEWGVDFHARLFIDYCHVSFLFRC